VLRLKRLLHVVAIVVLAGCGSTSVATHVTSSASPATSTSPSAGSSQSPSPSRPSPTPPPVGQYVVLATQGTGDSSTGSTAHLDGKVVASAQPSNPTPMTCGDAAAAVLPVPVSTSSTRAYFLDAQGNVNYLTPNGETGHATR